MYSGAIPLDSDILQINRNVQAALGFLASMVVGTGPVCDGLAFSPTSPASLTINIGPGSYTVASQVDQLAYGSLPSDASPLVKMGINLAATQFTLTAPSVPGQSINYIIEATLQESDANPAVLPYLNAANPAQTFAGPSNSGAAQNTLRIQRVGLQLKAGAAANTGSQLTPAVDIGWTAIYIITVNFGQTQITSANVTIAPGAPFVNPKLGAGGVNVRIKLRQNLNLYVATTGSDIAGNGTQAAPFATLQAAWNYIISSLDLNGFGITVNVANGTYSSGVHCVGCPVGAVGGVVNSPGSPTYPVKFLGNPGSPSSVVISASNSNCFQAANGAVIWLSGFRLTASGTGGNYNQQGTGLYASFNGSIAFSNIDFGTCSVSHMVSTVGSIVETDGPGISYSISGGSPVHIAVFDSSYATITDSTVTLVGTPAFAAAFVNIVFNGVLDARNVVSVGLATGQRFIVSNNGSINTAGAGPTYFPGSIAGFQGTATFGSIT